MRARGLDAVSAFDVGNVQLDDRAQLRYASEQDRALVTCNIRDFVSLAAEAVATNTEHWGIIPVPPSFGTDEFGLIAKAIERVSELYREGLQGVVMYLSRLESSGSIPIESSGTVSLTGARTIRHATDVMVASRWSVEQVLGAVRDLPPEAQGDVLSRLPSVLALSPEELAWLHLAEPAFAFWDNPEDAAYDAL